MREYELTVVYDLALQEAGGPSASEERLKQLVESRGGKILKIDHWGRRRMAYPIRHAIDADYIVSRIEAEPSAVNGIETALRIDEKVYRHLIVRADELPAPPPPRPPLSQHPPPQPRRQPPSPTPAKLRPRPTSPPANRPNPDPEAPPWRD